MVPGGRIRADPAPLARRAGGARGGGLRRRLRRPLPEPPDRRFARCGRATSWSKPPTARASSPSTPCASVPWCTRWREGSRSSSPSSPRRSGRRGSSSRTPVPSARRTRYSAATWPSTCSRCRSCGSCSGCSSLRSSWPPSGSAVGHVASGGLSLAGPRGFSFARAGVRHLSLLAAALLLVLAFGAWLRDPGGAERAVGHRARRLLRGRPRADARAAPARGRGVRGSGPRRLPGGIRPVLAPRRGRRFSTP